MADPEPALRVEDIHKSFGNIKVLRGISLEAYDHNVISILGSSGSGKSTLLRCINLLETPTSGKVYFRGGARPSLKNSQGDSQRKGGGHIAARRHVRPSQLLPGTAIGRSAATGGDCERTGHGTGHVNVR